MLPLAKLIAQGLWRETQLFSDGDLCSSMRPGATRAELDMNSRIVFWPLLITVFVGLVALLTSRVNEAQTNPVQATSNRCDMAFPLSNPSDIGMKKFQTARRSSRKCFRLLPERARS